VTHLLDSTAFFAFFFDEPGRRRVEELFRDPTVEPGLSILTSVELWARLKTEGRDEAFEQEWEDHLPLFERIISVDFTLCLKAIELRRAPTSRLPTIDSLIAATAAQHDAVLVHRDPHFVSIPKHLLKQELLPELEH
jgi:predicted nucleic acid-binding protein